jgi:hypothetical protein
MHAAIITATAAITAAIICTLALVIRRPSLYKRHTNDSALPDMLRSGVRCDSPGIRCPQRIRSRDARDQHISFLLWHIADISARRRGALAILRRSKAAALGVVSWAKGPVWLMGRCCRMGWCQRPSLPGPSSGCRRARAGRRWSASCHGCLGGVSPGAAGPDPRLLNHASWDTSAAMNMVRRFTTNGLEKAPSRVATASLASA